MSEQKLISVITVTKNRTRSKIENAADSLLKQTDTKFEWLVISDGVDSDTGAAISQISQTALFPIRYWELDNPHPNQFGLCLGRNLGRHQARGKYLTYLDDDNSLTADFIATTKTFLQQNLGVKYFLPQARRSRGIWQGDKFQRRSSFISPQDNTTIAELIIHQQLFDSNGFVHLAENAPFWNPNYRIYCDYEYLLQCIQTWGEDRFKMMPNILVNYIQSERGVIGSSNYRDWASELRSILFDKSYSLLKKREYRSQLETLQRKYDALARQERAIPAFKRDKNQN